MYANSIKPHDMQGYFLFSLIFLTMVQCKILTLRILEALENALDFVYDDCKDFNIDGVFGVILAEGKFCFSKIMLGN